MDRAQFIKLSLWGGIILHIPILKACHNHLDIPLSDTEAKILEQVLSILFPADEYGPSATDFKASEFIFWILKDPYYDPEQKDFIISGIEKLNALSTEKSGKNFHRLNQQEQEDLIESLSKDNRTIKNWLSFLISLCLEALLSDPIYGGNPNEIAWKWLQHSPGYPRASAQLKYPEMLILKQKTE